MSKSAKTPRVPRRPRKRLARPELHETPSYLLRYIEEVVELLDTWQLLRAAQAVQCGGVVTGKRRPLTVAARPLPSPSHVARRLKPPAIFELLHRADREIASAAEAAYRVSGPTNARRRDRALAARVMSETAKAGDTSTIEVDGERVSVLVMGPL